MSDAPEVTRTTCCIAGGGPVGLLLARAGVNVIVLEKHADLRDFRGDTIHSSTLEIVHELGFLALQLFKRFPFLRRILV